MLAFLSIYAELQEVDARRIALQTQLKAYPDMLAALESDLAAAQATLDGLLAEQDDGAREKRRLEQEVATLEERIRRYEAQEASVTSEKELHALEHEITALRRKADPLEERQIEILVRADDLDTAIPQAEAAMEATRERVATEKARIEGQIRSKREELGLLKQAWERLGAQLNTEQKRDFETLARRYPGSVLAPAGNGICLGCHTEILPNTLVGLRKGEAPFRCSQCNRFLYIPDQRPE